MDPQVALAAWLKANPFSRTAWSTSDRSPRRSWSTGRDTKYQGWNGELPDFLWPRPLRPLPNKTCLPCIFDKRDWDISISRSLCVYKMYMSYTCIHMLHMCERIITWFENDLRGTKWNHTGTSSRVASLACCNAWPSSRKAAATTSWAFHVAVSLDCSKERIQSLL